MSLVVAPCSRKAAEFAVLRWHYSKRMPRARLVTFGVWEAGEFIGAVVFSRGATFDLGKPYGLGQTECAELVRVALRQHDSHVTAIVAQALKLLHRTSPGLRLIVSFADPEHGHRGGIYQAGNWLYLGTTHPDREWIVNGQRIHNRTLLGYCGDRRPGETKLQQVQRVLDPNAKRVTTTPKHRYIYPLDRPMRRKIMPLAKPYPAAEVSTATHLASGEEGQVRPLQAAPTGK